MTRYTAFDHRTPLLTHTELTGQHIVVLLRNFITIPADTIGHAYSLIRVYGYSGIWRMTKNTALTRSRTWLTTFTQLPAQSRKDDVRTLWWRHHYAMTSSTHAFRHANTIKTSPFLAHQLITFEQKENLFRNQPPTTTTTTTALLVNQSPFHLSTSPVSWSKATVESNETVNNLKGFVFRLFVCMFVCMFVCLHVLNFIYVCVCVCVCNCVFVCLLVS